jgi:hypothetical protein
MQLLSVLKSVHAAPQRLESGHAAPQRTGIGPYDSFGRVNPRHWRAYSIQAASTPQPPSMVPGHGALPWQMALLALYQAANFRLGGF